MAQYVPKNPAGRGVAGRLARFAQRLSKDSQMAANSPIGIPFQWPEGFVFVYDI